MSLNLILDCSLSLIFPLRSRRQALASFFRTVSKMVLDIARFSATLLASKNCFDSFSGAVALHGLVNVRPIHFISHLLHLHMRTVPVPAIVAFANSEIWHITRFSTGGLALTWPGLHLMGMPLLICLLITGQF